MPFYDYRDEPEMLKDAQLRAKPQAQNANDALVAKRLGEIYGRHPYMQAGVALSLAEAGADMAMVDQVAMKSATVGYSKAQQNASGQKNPTDVPPEFNESLKVSLVKKGLKGLSWLGGNTLGRISGLKTASRWTQAAFQFPFEYAANYGSLKTDPDKEAKEATASSRWVLPENMFASTSLGAMLQRGSESGEGFFVGGEAEEKRVEKVKKFRWQINGESYTVGRGTANMILTPGSKPYKFLSGLIDGTIAVLADPSTVGGKALKSAKAARTAIPALEGAEEIAGAMKLARGGAGLLSTAEQHAIDTSKFFNWLDNSRIGQRIVTTATEETDSLRMLEAFDYKISVDDAKRLADAKTADEVRGIIGEAATRLKDETEFAQVQFPTSSQALPISKKIPAYRLRHNSRWLTQVPEEALLIHGTPEDNIKAVRNLANYLKTIKVDPYSGEGKILMDQAFVAFAQDGTRVDKDIVMRLFLGDDRKKIKGILHTSLQAAGLTADEIQPLLETMRTGLQTLQKYAVDTAGLTDDGGRAIHLTQQMTDKELLDLLSEVHPNKVFPGMTRADMDNVVAAMQPGELTIHGPMSLSQMLNHMIVLPDPRQMRRLTNNPFWRLNNEGRELGAKQLAMYLQNEVWRPWALTSVGYLVRNSMDATMRLGLHGYLSNPIDYILMGLGRRGLGTVNEGQLWREAAEIGPNDFSDVDDFLSWTRRTAQNLTDDPAKSIAHLIKTNQVAVLEPSDLAYAQGLVDNARVVYASPEQRFYAQIMHLPDDQQHRLFVNWLDSGSKEAVKARKNIVAYLTDGPVVANRNNGVRRARAPISNAANMTTDEIVESWFEVGNKWQVDNFTQQTDEMRAVVGYGDVPNAPSEIWDEATARSYSTTGAPVRPGELLVDDLTIDPLNPQFRYWRVLEMDRVVAPGGRVTRNYKVIEVVDPGDALNPDRGTQSLNGFIRRSLEDNANRNPGDPMRIPARVLGRVRTEAPTELEGVTKTAAGAVRAAQFIPRMFFEKVVGRWESAIDRSPAFKKAFYQAISENVRLLSPAEAQKLLDNIGDFARRDLPALYAKDPLKAMDQWIGGGKLIGKSRLDEIIEGATEAQRRGNGIGTVEQLQDYASTKALRDLEDLFFQSVQQNNIQDATKLVAPFGAAWANVAGRYAREAIENPFRVRKAQLIYKGFADADPDNDGRGFIWKDPTTGQNKFTFPLYGRITEALTGIPGIEWTAPVSRLSAGFSAIPAFGPMVQIAGSEVFDKFAVPGLDTYRKFVTPFGDVGFKSMIPGTLQKAFSAMFDSPDKLESMYGNTYVDVFRHLSATGEYDLTDSNDRIRLNDDAKSKARVIAMLRSLGQFVGPTAPSPDYRYKKGAGQYYYTSEMINWFRDEQAKNYDTAVENFLNTFGDQALIYVTGKTKVMDPYGGIDATEQFQLWERQNADLVQVHKEVAGYLAPGGVEADFSMPVWSRQIAAGMRRRVDPLDQLAAAQYTVGAALVRARRKQYGPDINSKEKAALKEYRKEIVAKYPGFQTAAKFDTKGFDNMLGNLRELLADPRTADNKVAATAKEYLRLRDEAYRELQDEEGVTFAADSNDRAVELKTFLYNYGEQLAAENPDFSRLWQRELSAEVEE